MVDLPIGNKAHVAGIGLIECVADIPGKPGCLLCVLRDTADCASFDCQSYYRYDKRNVHFEKAKTEGGEND